MTAKYTKYAKGEKLGFALFAYFAWFAVETSSILLVYEQLDSRTRCGTASILRARVEMSLACLLDPLARLQYGEPTPSSAIVDENGNPISGAIVRTDMDFKNQVDDRFRWFTHAEPDGRFEWDSAPARTLCFWFEADGYETIRGTPMLPDGTDHEIVLRRKRSSVR